MPIGAERGGKVAIRRGEGFLYSSFLLGTSAAVPVPIALGIADSVMFVTPRGVAGQGYVAALTDLETNMDNAGQLPNELGFSISQIGFIPNTRLPLRLVNRLAASGTLRLIMPEWEYNLGPAEMFPGGVGVQGVATGGGVELGSLGLPTRHSRMVLKDGLLLPGGKTFRFAYRVQTAYAIPAAEQIPLEQISIKLMLWGRWESRV